MPLRARVDVVERLGSETLVHLVAGETPILARVDPRTRARAGDDVEFSADVSRLHVFDRETGLAIVS
jgi:multiple sugar transport system ATP-binding protein